MHRIQVALFMCVCFVAVVACGSDAVADTSFRRDRSLEQPFPADAIAPELTIAPPEIAAASLESCINAIVIALTKHSHNDAVVNALWNPAVFRVGFPIYTEETRRSNYESQPYWDGTESKLGILLTPCDSFR